MVRFSPSIEQRKQFYNGPVSFKGSRMQLFFNCGYVTAGCCGCLYKCIASNGKLVMCCILTNAMIKYTEYVYFTNINVKTIQFHTSRCLLEVNHTFL